MGIALGNGSRPQIRIVRNIYLFSPDYVVVKRIQASWLASDCSWGGAKHKLTPHKADPKTLLAQRDLQDPMGPMFELESSGLAIVTSL